MQNNLERLFRFLASKELAAGLLLLLCVVLIPRTFQETEEITAGLLPRMIHSCLAVNLVFCTIKRIRSFSKAVLVIHVGAVVVLIGTVIGSFGYVATANVYEGTSVDSVYRWDVKKRDATRIRSRGEENTPAILSGACQGRRAQRE